MAKKLSTELANAPTAVPADTDTIVFVDQVTKTVKSVAKSNLVSTIVDADGATKGKVQLAGALGGTAAAPTALGMANAAALTSALGGKVDVLSQSTLGAGATAITHLLHANRPLIVNQAGATSGTFANTATSGAIAGDSVYVRNTGTANFSATGAITAPPGYKLLAIPSEAFSADYDSVDDAWVSTTPDLATGNIDGGTPTSVYGGTVNIDGGNP